jgi:NodT family efflux transporter outer membrane factor (OMF) lipoprotein
MQRRIATLPSRARALVLSTALLAAACTVVGRDHEPPTLPVPDAWQAEPGFADGAADLAAWWRRLDDPVLDMLVERALGDGLDLRGALARVREARALRAFAAGERLPSLDVGLGFERRGESANTPLGSFVPDTSIWSAGFDAAWEVDLWGRLRRSLEAADADLAAEREDARWVAVSVAAETAVAYVELRAFQRRLSLARTNVSLQDQTLELVSTRFEAGLVGERDVAQARSNVETTRSRVPALEAGLRAAGNRLAVLLGRAPGAQFPELAAELAAERPIPLPPADVATGVPADLLRRRPDVRRAERLLAAEVARTGVAEGELWPRLVLAGSLGVAAQSTGDLAQHDSGFFSIGPSLRWNVFDAGRRRALVHAQDARAEEALVDWEAAVLRALEEAENARSRFVREKERRDRLAAAADQARRAVELAQTQYREGLTDFQAVLDSERALAALDDELAQSDAAITTGVIALYKALGGGFEHDPLAAAVADAR